MPHTQSAFKRMRQHAKRRLYNRDVKSGLRTVLKKVAATVKAGDPARIQADLREAIRQVDKAAAKGVLHRNTAARRKSGLMRLAASATTTAAAKPV